VVWREARLRCRSAAERGGGARELRERFDPQQYALDVRQAPIQRAFIASDGTADRWLLLWLSHHLVIDHVSLELIIKEVRRI